MNTESESAVVKNSALVFAAVQTDTTSRPKEYIYI